MKNKKILALILAATMAAGSSMTVFATQPTTGTIESEGTSYDHVDQEVIAVTLPTSTTLATVFDYYADPEGTIKSAGQLLNGTAVTVNNDGVYFTNAGSAAVNGNAVYTSATNTGNYTVVVDDLTVNETYTYDGTTDNQWEDSEGNAASVAITITDDNNNNAVVTPANGDKVVVSGGSAAVSAGYSSTSDTVIFEGNNSVDMDVTVAATVDNTNAAKDITLVADEDALAAATGPALLMNLKVGTETKAITTEGVTAKAMIAGVPSNFKMVPNAAGTQFEFGLKDAADLTAWNSTTVQLSGKTNDKDIPAGAGAMTVPKITLTWTIAKHVSGPQVTMTDDGVITMSGLTAAKNYAHSAILSYGDSADNLDVDPNLEWDTDDWTAENGGTLIFRLSEAWLNALDGLEATVTVKLSDDTNITTTHQF